MATGAGNDERGTDSPGRPPVDLTLVRGERTSAAPPSPMRVVMAPDAEPTFAALYRTEDIAIAPDGRRAAIPGFFSDHVVVADLDVVRGEGANELHVGDPVVVQCEQLRYPHGVVFIDENLLLIANRGAELLALDLPPRGAGQRTVFRKGRVLVAEDDPVPVRAPGSLAVRRVGGLCEVLVCNNESHDVVRYVIDVDDDLRVIDRERLIGDGLDTPDGVAISRSGRWIAVCNHTTHEVFVFAYEPESAIAARRVGTLRGPNYPHGVQFADDDRAILLNDAGLPYMYVFSAPDGDWSGTRDPARTVRVMDDATFNAARYNPQEGGPKGLAVLEDQHAVVATSTSQRFACFDLDEVLGGSSRAVDVPKATSVPAGDQGSADLVRRSLRRVADTEAALAEQVHRAAELEQALADAGHRAAELDQALAEHQRRTIELDAERRRESDAAVDVLRAELDELRVELDRARREREAAAAALAAVEHSTSWRITRPVRALLDAVRRP